VLKLQGDIAVGFKDYDTARDAYQAAAVLDPRFVQVRVDLGRVFEIQGDASAAERCFREALDILPTHHDATLALAGLYRRRGAPKAAVNLLVEMLGVDSSNLDAMVALGHALMDDGRAGAALEVFRHALAVDSRHVPAHFFAGAAYARLQHYPEAVAAWDEVVRLDPSGPLAAEARKHSRTAQDLSRIFHNEAA
jgi:tetratricopeptide (TPR) repeat protein